MLAKDAGPAHERGASPPAHVFEGAMKVRRGAGNGRRAERGDTVPRQPRGKCGERTRWIERVVSFHAVDMHVDEAGNDPVPGHIDSPGARRIEAKVRVDRGDPVAID